MLFNSFVFVAFFAVVYSLYLFLQRGPHVRLQNALLLGASYLFYGYWDWRFLALLAGATVLDFSIALWIGRTTAPRARRLILTTSILSNLGVLGFFKYFNFFQDSFVKVLGAVGFAADAVTLNVILPIGLSFYTFQTMSYVIDVYRGKLAPSRNLAEFALFVAFFPQLVAGPIERATTLLPQVVGPRRLRADQIKAGIFLIVWGYYKKVVIADNLALIVNQVFDNHQAYQGADLAVATLAFAFQIYGDFSGYSDIARGLSKLLGFDLMVNFRLPYFASSPSDFWSRWHISLSTWLRDYLYVPLGGNRYGNVTTYRNLALTMLIGGLWHGAAWNFVLWGAFHGAILIIYRLVAWPSRTLGVSPVVMRDPLPAGLSGLNEVVRGAFAAIRGRTLGDAVGARHACAAELGVGLSGVMGMADVQREGDPGHGSQRHDSSTSPARGRHAQAPAPWSPGLLVRIAIMFALTNIGWILFRANSAEQALYFFSNMGISTSRHTLGFGYELIFFTAPLLAVQCWQHTSGDLMVLLRLPLAARVAVYAGLLLLIAVFGVREATEFIYFQF